MGGRESDWKRERERERVSERAREVSALQNLELNAARSVCGGACVSMQTTDDEGTAMQTVSDCLRENQPPI